MSTNVSYKLPKYDEYLPRWERVRAAVQGEEEVKKLPRVLPYLNPNDLSPENIRRNEQYLERAVYFNATGRTLEGLIGLAFAKTPKNNLGEFTYLQDDSEGEGVNIYHVAQEGLSGILQTGRHGFLSDIVNDRPVVVGYRAESIINWRSNKIAGKNQLELLVLQEVISEAEGDYSSKDVVQYREFRNDGQNISYIVWRAEAGGEPKKHDSGYLAIPHSSKIMPEIPFAFCGSINNSSNIQPAPLKGLAEMNLAHFRDSADYQDSVFYCGQVQAWISGLDETWRDHLEKQGAYVGSRKVLLLPVNGKMGMEQAQPNMLAKEAMTDKKEAMVALGARVVEQSPVTKTATQAAGDIATNTSVLGLATGNVSEAITLSIRRLGYYRNARAFEEAEFEVTQDFTEQAIDPDKLRAMVESWQAGAFSRIDLRAKLRQMGMISPERTDAQIDEEVDSELRFRESAEPTNVS